MMPNACVHFRGIQFSDCAAGVPLESVKDTSVLPFRWPCLAFAGKEASTTCSKRRLPTVEEWDAQEKAIGELLLKLAAGESPCCGGAITEVETREGRSKAGYCATCKKLLFRGCGR